MVGPRYFSTLGIPLLLGREILESDTSSAPRVCVINESFAKKFFAGRNPLGLHVGIVDEGPHGNTVTTYAVAGVARDARTSTLRGEVEPRVYEPIVQNHGDNVKRASFLIRSATPVLPAVREVFRRVDPGLRVTTRSMEEQLEPWTAPERTIASVVSVFGGVALVLAAIGLYGVLSYSVARRQGEIAVRMALGARGSRVVAMILGETVRLVAIGLAAGAALAWIAVRIVRDSLFGVAPGDPATVAAAIALLVVVALAAAFLPARRASRLDPMTALRGE
jgi:hypothetical protein